jgi:hypothetical protein
MVGGRRAILAGFAAMVAGCGPKAPEYQDALADLSHTRTSDVPLDVPVTAGPTQAVTFGSNVEAFLEYNDKGLKYAASVGASQKLLAEGSPQVLVDGAVGILRRRYPELKAVDDLATARRQKFATTFVVDIRNKAGIWPGDQTTIDLIIIAFDAQMKPVSRLVGHGAVTIKPYVVPEVGLANRQALADLDAKAQRLLS